MQNWKKYGFEFLSIFVAVITAFALNNWNDNRRDSYAEVKILTEILNGLHEDVLDVGSNADGHKLGIRACKFWRRVFNDEPVELDSLRDYYHIITRDFVSIQNTSGYETLKSRGFELISNDSLRKKIISLYEYDYQFLKKLEEEYYELQFQENYFDEINRAIAPHFTYNDTGHMTDLALPLRLPQAERNLLLSYLWKIQGNRRFILQLYQQVEGNIDTLIGEIEQELKE
ncbi:MAG: hypothetical protein AAFQ98_07510 [Bacteroidota bacterium]